jgi:hypothetical protein
MTDKNCLKIDGHVFNITWDDIPTYLFFVEVALPYAFTTRKGQIAINPLSGKVLAWRFLDEERGLVTEWSRWDMLNSIPVTLHGSESGSYSWQASYQSERPNEVNLQLLVRYGSNFIRTYDNDVVCTWKKLLSHVDVNLERATNIQIREPEESWRS